MSGDPNVRWVMLGYGPFGRRVLEASVEEGWSPAAVMTDDLDSDLDDVSVRSVAQAANIPVSAENPNTDGFKWLESIHPEILFTVNYRWILTDSVLSIPRKWGFNVHDSLLPILRGRSPLTWAIILGHRETGVTVHTLGSEVDTGDIVFQTQIPIAVSDTSASILSKMLDIYPQLVRSTLEVVAEGNVPLRSQDGEASYGATRRPEDGAIDWSWSATRIYDWVRALTRPYPGAFTHLNGERLTVWQASAIELTSEATKMPGSVIGECVSTSGGQGWAVACGRGIVCIESYEPELDLGVGALLGP